MANRYKNQEIFTNTKDVYKRYLKSRGMTQIKQFGTPKFKYPSLSEIANFDTINHIWTVGDRYYKLAYEYYGDAEKWWIIAFYNQKPTEFHITPGEVVYIPVPLDTVLFYIGY